MAKNTMGNIGKEHLIKRGYYSKLGIERTPNLASSYKFYPPTKKVIIEEDDGYTKIRKSSSSELKTDPPLELKDEVNNSPVRENIPEELKGLEEGKIEDEKVKPKNNKHVFRFMKKFSKYFDSEWSFAKFRVTDSRTICAFTKEENLVVISADGTYYLARLDTKNGGECKKIEEKKFV